MNNQNFIIKYCELELLQEDMFQAEYWNIILDIWYYNNYFKLLIIKQHNWEQPLEEVIFKDKNLIDDFLSLFKWKIMKWYYA